MDAVRVRLLGGLVVEGCRPHEVGSRKARTLLGTLAVARGVPVAADVLAEVLWGEDLPARPSDQVGVLVSRLRGVLGAERFPRSDAGYAVVTDWLDLHELDAGAVDAERAATRGDALTARLTATMALDLVRGPLLPEEPSPWFDAARASVARSVAATRLLAAEAALVSGDPAGAVALAAGGLDHDPYDEAALRAVMRGHVALGRPASALARSRSASTSGKCSPTRTTTPPQTTLRRNCSLTQSPKNPRPATSAETNRCAETVRPIREDPTAETVPPLPRRRTRSTLR